VPRETVANDDVRLTADQLLAAVAAIRRTLRRTSGRPGVLTGLTTAQVELVYLLRREPRISVAEAAERLRLAPNTVSTLVGQLTAAGLVVRGSDPSDRRVVRLDLEPGIRQRVSEWRDRRAEVLARAIEALPAAEQEVLHAAAQTLAGLAGTLDIGGTDSDGS